MVDHIIPFVLGLTILTIWVIGTHHLGKLHGASHNSEDVPFFVGVILQIMVIIALVVILFISYVIGKVAIALGTSAISIIY